MHMTIRVVFTGLMTVALATPVLASAPLSTVAEVTRALTAAGYTQVHEIERDDGLWEADVTRSDGRFAEVLVDPVAGEIFDAHDGRAVLDAGQVMARAAGHGLKDIRKLERDGATWKLEARNAQNQPVEVRLSGVDGRILHSKRERWWD